MRQSWKLLRVTPPGVRIPLSPLDETINTWKTRVYGFLILYLSVICTEYKSRSFDFPHKFRKSMLYKIETSTYNFFHINFFSLIRLHVYYLHRSINSTFLFSHRNEGEGAFLSWYNVVSFVTGSKKLILYFYFQQ